MKTPEIVLTGGPCSGKTTGINYISEKLRDRGVRTFLVPEVATMLITGGVSDIGSVAQNNHELYYHLEKEMLLINLALRQRYQALAQGFPEEKKVIIFDRGPMDVKAYIGNSYFQVMLDEERLTLNDVRDSFDTAIHLVTAAIGAEKFYTCENNKARRETLEEARDADRRTLNAYNGHPHLVIINNRLPSFEHKMKRLLAVVLKSLHMPAPLEIERKYLLKCTPDFSIPELQNAQKISIEQIYLISPTEQSIRIRKRSQSNSSTYYKAIKSRISDTTRTEVEVAIQAKDYLGLQSLRDQTTHVIHKDRYCFIYEDQYFELDIFQEPARGLVLLEIELTEENDEVVLPPFLQIEREVTGNESYSNHAIAKGMLHIN